MILINDYSGKEYEYVLYKALSVLQSSGSETTIEDASRIINTNKTLLISDEDKIIGFTTYKVLKNSISCIMLFIESDYRNGKAVVLMKKFYFDMSKRLNKDIVYTHSIDNIVMNNFSSKYSDVSIPGIGYNTKYVREIIKAKKRVSTWQ